MHIFGLRLCNHELFFPITAFDQPSSTLLRRIQRYLLSPDLVCLHLGLMAGIWTDVMSSIMSGFGRHSPRLKIIALHEAPTQANGLALCGLSHIQRASLTLLIDDAF
jgi:hypothetical protein